MAEFSKRIFIDVPIEDKYICRYCDEILHNPLQTHCGHRYCRQCFEELLRNEGDVLCSSCREEGIMDSLLNIEQAYPDRAIARELNKHNVQCINIGCDWTGSFKDYKLDHNPTCEYEMIKCVNRNGCNVSIQRGNLSSHLEKDCPMRIVKCEHCQHETAFIDMEIHLRECADVTKETNSCKEKTVRKTMTDHTEPESSICSKDLVFCDFKEIGCEDMEKKILCLQSDEKRIADRLSRLSTRNERENSEDDALVRTVEKHDKSIVGLNNCIAVTNKKINTCEGMIVVLNNEVGTMTDNVTLLSRQQKKYTEMIEALEKKVKAQDRIIALKDVAIAEQDLRIQSLEMASYDGVLVWKITDFAPKRQDAISGRTTSIYSPCFYSSRHGYKMCARIYINGDGMGKGNHVSLFFVIMKGESDALLRWPFRQKVTMMWLDQINKDHVIDAFRPDPTSSSFQRPKHDMNIASGCPLFMPLSQLESLRHHYVRDDTAFIKIFVDTSDLS
uniref:TNF receptor-associated factor 2-like n=1 Tax=Saccoglossus kowalevskii TaxID=10224 RepID=A0ABM0GZW0_SACKO|nr:PREDICTED: TNF receptor-associated factor 2-like [Saccoglossus kowalevskii]